AARPTVPRRPRSRTAATAPPPPTSRGSATMNLRSLLCAGLGRSLTGNWAATGRSRAADVPADAEGFRTLFNGKDLSGWVPVNVAPETFTVRDGLIVSTGVPTGVMRTERPYENFIIELEWRHVKPGGNAGLFVWADALPDPG